MSRWVARYREKIVDSTISRNSGVACECCHNIGGASAAHQPLGIRMMKLTTSNSFHPPHCQKHNRPSSLSSRRSGPSLENFPSSSRSFSNSPRARTPRRRKKRKPKSKNSNQQHSMMAKDKITQLESDRAELWRQRQILFEKLSEVAPDLDLFSMLGLPKPENVMAEPIQKCKPDPNDKQQANLEDYPEAENSAPQPAQAPESEDKTPEPINNNAEVDEKAPPESEQKEVVVEQKQVELGSIKRL